MRILAAVALFVAVAGFFRQPLAQVVFPGLETWAAEAGLGNAVGLGPAPGFLLQADSDPPGGTLLIDGEDAGPLPFVGNVVCRKGEEVTFEVQLEGYATWTRTVDCHEGLSLQLTARLRP